MSAHVETPAQVPVEAVPVVEKKEEPIVAAETSNGTPAAATSATETPLPPSTLNATPAPATVEAPVASSALETPAKVTEPATETAADAGTPVTDAAKTEGEAVESSDKKVSPKKSKKSILSRISGIFSFNGSPEKPQKVAESSKTVEPTPEIVDPTAETTTTEPAVESVSTAPQSVPKKQESTVDVVAKDLEAVKIAEQPAVTETEKGSAAEPPKPLDLPTAETTTATAVDDKNDETAKPATPKMHRRISARIGQFIDTKFGDKKTPGEGKKEKAVKKDGEATSSSSSEEEGEGKVAKVKKSKKSKGKKEVKEVEEAKKDEVPVLAAPVAVEPLGEVVAPSNAATVKAEETKAEESIKPAETVATTA